MLMGVQGQGLSGSSLPALVQFHMPGQGRSPLCWASRRAGTGTVGYTCEGGHIRQRCYSRVSVSCSTVSVAFINSSHR